jgi:hypothetical protein
MTSRRRRPHLYPTRKWWATQITASTALATAWVSAGHWDKTLTLAAIGVVSQAAVVYLVPNADPAPKPSPATTPAPAPSPVAATAAVPG